MNSDAEMLLFSHGAEDTLYATLGSETYFKQTCLSE